MTHSHFFSCTATAWSHNCKVVIHMSQFACKCTFSGTLFIIPTQYPNSHRIFVVNSNIESVTHGAIAQM